MGFQAERGDRLLRALAEVDREADAQAEEQLQMGVAQMLDRDRQFAAGQMLEREVQVVVGHLDRLAHGVGVAVGVTVPGVPVVVGVMVPGVPVPGVPGVPVVVGVMVPGVPGVPVVVGVMLPGVPGVPVVVAVMVVSRVGTVGGGGGVPGAETASALGTPSGVMLGFA